MLVCRFAPSPNGRLHLGHAFSALLNADTARAAGGRFLVRLEDIDVTRCRPDYAAAIMADLEWLGLTPAESPRVQSAHLADYAGALARLEAMGLVYPAFESRAEIARAVAERQAQTGQPVPRDPDGAPLYPFSREAMADTARARRRAAGEPYVLRLDMAAALAATSASLQWREARGAPLGPLIAVPENMAAACSAAAGWGDVVLSRRDAPGSYHLCVVVDDALQGVTHVIRGADLKAATSVHILLQHLLGLPEPVYHHHRLVLDEAGRKLSKSSGSTGLDELRRAGATPQDIRARLDLPPEA